MGDITLIWCPPSQGKSYLGTKMVVDWLKKGERVFTDFPVKYTVPFKFHQWIINSVYRLFRKKPKYPRRYLESLKWETEYETAHLNNCKIVLDEAYRYYSSHKRTVEGEVHDFFATTGHCDVDIVLIAQHYNRINLTLREIANYYVYVEKINNPISLRNTNPREDQLMPLFFIVSYYTSEDDFKLRRIKPTEYKKERVWFSGKIAKSYNTQQFRIPEKLIHPLKWSEHIYAESKKEIMNEQEAIEEFAKSVIV